MQYQTNIIFARSCSIFHCITCFVLVMQFQMQNVFILCIHSLLYVCNTILQTNLEFWPRVLLKGPKRSFAFVVLFLLLGVKPWAKNVLNLVVMDPNSFGLVFIYQEYFIILYGKVMEFLNGAQYFADYAFNLTMLPLQKMRKKTFMKNPSWFLNIRVEFIKLAFICYHQIWIWGKYRIDSIYKPPKFKILRIVWARSIRVYTVGELSNAYRVQPFVRHILKISLQPLVSLTLALHFSCFIQGHQSKEIPFKISPCKL